MPYKEDGSNIPENVKQKIKGKPNKEKLARQWAKVWNDVFKRTGDEGKAFEIANGILHDRINNELFKKMTSI